MVFRVKIVLLVLFLLLTVLAAQPVLEVKSQSLVYAKTVLLVLFLLLTVLAAQPVLVVKSQSLVYAKTVPLVKPQIVTRPPAQNAHQTSSHRAMVHVKIVLLVKFLLLTVLAAKPVP